MHEALATRLQTAFNARDIETFRSLLATDATWGEDPESDTFCRDRNDIIGHINQLLADGVDATIVQTTIGPRRLAVRLHVEWPDPEDQHPDLQTVYQSYTVADDLITEIHGHDDEESALAAISR